MRLLEKFRRDDGGSAVEKLALLAAVLTVASVLSASFFSNLLEKGDFPVVVLMPDAKLKGLAKSAPAARPGGGAPPNVGVDMAATATIPGKSGAQLSPCGVGQK